MAVFLQSIVLIILLTTVPILKADSKTDTILQSKVKAAYIYNFSRFVHWTGRSNEKIRICVVGDKAVAKLLKELITQRSQTSDVEIMVSNSIEDFSTCHLFYISHTNPNINEILKKANIDNVLTISDAKTFARRGGMIGLYIEDVKMYFEININRTEAAKIKVSSKLLSLARVIKE